MRLTKKRLELLQTAVAYYATMLFDDEMWRDDYDSEPAAQSDVDGIRAWIEKQLNKRGA